MKTTLTRLLLTSALSLLCILTGSATPPPLLSHQGRIAVDGTNFNGTGYFKFALVSGATDTWWSHDGTSVDRSEPTSSVAVAVTNGHYAIELGDTSIANVTEDIDAEIFENQSIYLRIWFSTTVDGNFSLLTPDQRILPTGYAHKAATADSVKGLRVQPPITGSVPNIIAGSSSNQITGGQGSVIAGGGNSPANGNSIDGNYSVIGGGAGNAINAVASVIPGGQFNSVTANFSYAAGNRAKANHRGSFVWADTSPPFEEFGTSGENQFLIRAAGGVGIGTNTPRAALDVKGDLKVGDSAGTHSSITNNEIQAKNGMETTNLTINHDGGDVFVGGFEEGDGADLYVRGELNSRAVIAADGTGTSTSLTGNRIQGRDGDQPSGLAINFSGGPVFIGGSESPDVGANLTVRGNIIATGDITSTAVNITSDRNAKSGFVPINPSDVLLKVAKMPITRWHYKKNPETLHIGPMAQDFHAAFATGADDKHITTVDADGVALASIQALYNLAESQRLQIGKLTRRLEELEKKQVRVEN